jgi:CheY-like chemotaxis protein
MLRRLIGEDIELVTALDPNLGRTRADPGQLEQAILNLVTNARDAMPDGGKLTIETAGVVLDEASARQQPELQAGPFVLVAVHDTGTGMDAETQARIFEPFFSTKELGKGTGLGLSTVYGIVAQSGGNISVSSEPGRGTTFKIYLPRVDEPLEEAPREPATGTVPRGAETLLVTEDEAGVRELVRRALEQRGYTVLVARDGAEAQLLAAEYRKPIHLLVTDMVMPGMNGRDLAEQIAAARPDIRVLFLSGYASDVIARQGVLEKGLAFLQKPFTPDDLACRVREVLDR